VNILPNPASDLVSIQVQSIAKTDIALSLLDLTGKEVQRATLYQGSTIAYLDIRTVYAGTYFIVMTVNGKQQVKKLVIQK
jgi:YbbR domain-containing protein